MQSNISVWLIKNAYNIHHIHFSRGRAYSRYANQPSFFQYPVSNINWHWRIWRTSFISVTFMGLTETIKIIVKNQVFHICDLNKKWYARKFNIFWPHMVYLLFCCECKLLKKYREWSFPEEMKVLLVRIF